MKSLMSLSLIMVAGIAWVTGPDAPVEQPMPSFRLVPISSPGTPPLLQRGASFSTSWRPASASTYFGQAG
ncbi:hypothetical protein SAMN06273572_101462 [Monaibacterium marinum]|uniref:Uncharacterized protein n=1 Tax=Pontivivens marinum TaxID=1690039 RepID=A0A2C9CMS4_9RHOB|nr:hypothetical protein [Monaibacterium marinum]SOH92614.1 hypothetical protein SAMN06273572_101462 [Monaibacterium marinum]